MTTDTETLLMIRGAIASLPEDEQLQVKQALAEIEAIQAKYGDAAQMAIALVGASLAAA